MPLFGRHSEPVKNTPVDTRHTNTTTAEPRRSGTLFNRRRDSPPITNSATTHSSQYSTRSNSPPRRGLLHRNDGDPSIHAAHQRVLTAEAAEKEADKALLHARAMVKEAREHVRRLEREAAEDARLAKIKQKEASAISKRAGRLGGL